MKSKVSPLALGGVLALCVMVLGFAWWTLTSVETQLEPETNLESRAKALNSGGPVEPAHPLTPRGGTENGSESERVALVDDEHPPARAQAEFELRSSNDHPLSGARAWLRRGEELLGTCPADASGVTHFDAGPGHAELIVLAKERPAFARDVLLTAGRQLIVLERGAAVSGRVRVAKEGAVANVDLVLTSDRPLVDDSNWPEAVRKALSSERLNKLRLITHTDESGQFEFSGLTLPWSGKLEVDEAHELIAVSGGVWAEGSDSIRLDDPIDGLVLDLAALEMARGRVVASAGGPGIANASVNGALTFEGASPDDDDPIATFDGRTGSDGSFALPIHRRGGFDSKELAQGNTWPVLKSASLTLDGAEEIPRRRLELSGSQLPEGFDFGELVLERGATLQFVASDAQGKPLAGAIGRLDGERSEPTDETGHSSIVFAPGTGRPLTVTLEGYRDARVELPKELSAALSVVLERTNRLTVIVHNPDGEPAVGIVVQLIGQHQGPQRGRGRNNRVSEQRTDAKGHADFSNMLPATPLTVSVRDAMGASVAERGTTLAADEWSTLELTIPRALLSFSGVVRDELGLALAEAGLDFTDAQNPNRGSVSARSDADGRFEFSGLGSSVGTLRVRKTGFAPLSLTQFQIPALGVIADIRLERGLRVTLRVVDSRGAPVRGENLRLEMPGERPFQGRRTGDNEWDFSNLPHVTMTAIGSVGSREYRHEMEPLNGNQDFLVPVQGGLEVSLRLQPALLQTTIRISLRARDDRRVAPAQSLTGETLQTKTFAPLLPGDYQLVVMQMSAEGGRGNWTPLGAAQQVTIREGAILRLEIER